MVTASREELEASYGKVWTTDEMREEFEVLGFSMGYCVVQRKSDGKRGCLAFLHAPRFYFKFQETAHP